MGLALAIGLLTAGCSVGGTREPARVDLPAHVTFSDAECDEWPGEEDEKAVVGCDDGAYRILVKHASPQEVGVQSTRTGSLRVEADTRVAAGPRPEAGHAVLWGVTCLPARGRRGYAFVVNGLGRWWIIRVARRFSDSPVLASGRAPSRFIDPERLYRLRVDCVTNAGDGTLVSGWVGDERLGVASTSRSGASFERFGFLTVANDDGREVRFDNVEARALTAGEKIDLDDAAAKPALRTVRKETFSSPTFAFAGGRSGGLVESLDDGAYVIRAEQPWVGTDIPLMITATRRVVIDVDLENRQVKRFVRYDEGVTCGLSGGESYAFLVQPEEHTASIMVSTESESRDIASKPPSHVVHRPPGRNHLHAECYRRPDGATELTLKLNGVAVLRRVGPGGEPFDQVAIEFANTAPGVEGRFDNLVIRAAEEPR
ncbi:MAG: hypothetical protein M3327_13060 [Actinomycetota bacterium]|nr:hypothetical protein [Actinomycetota bacterium]